MIRKIKRVNLADVFKPAKAVAKIKVSAELVINNGLTDIDLELMSDGSVRWRKVKHPAK